jgi:hypothetical protein
MANGADIRPLLPRDGTSQAQRRLRALDPAQVQVDERAAEDLLVFASRLAEQVKYYDLDGRDRDAGGLFDWTPFFEKSTTVRLAEIARYDVQAVRRRFEDRRTQSGDTPEALFDLFTQLRDLARVIEEWRTVLDRSTPLRDRIRRLVQANLASMLRRLVAFERAAAGGLAGYPPLDLADRYGGFGAPWAESGDTPGSLRTATAGTGAFDPSAIAPEPGFFGDAATVAEQVQVGKTRLRDLFAPLHNTLLEIQRTATVSARTRMGLSTEGRPGEGGRETTFSKHEPHIGLLIAFLRLYGVIQEDANELPQHHLDFFYRRVLGFSRKDPVPDEVHLLVELARRVDEHRIAAGTEVNAGKDASGVPRIYRVADDVVVNTAQIESLRTLYLDLDRNATGFPETKRILGLHAAPVANSADGEGGAFEEDERPSWPTLGTANAPGAVVGFALASRSLAVAEGTRAMTLDVHCHNERPEQSEELLSAAQHGLTLELSGPEGWIAPSVTASLQETGADGTVTLRFATTLKPDDPPITGYDAEVYGTDLGTTLPVARVTVTGSIPDDSVSESPPSHPYDALRGLVVDDVTLTLDVDGVQGIVIQNDQFTGDPAKPFQIFGATPKSGAHFYAGSAEAFQKNLTRLTLDLTWEDPPDSFADHYAGYAPPGDLPETGDFRVEAAVLQDRGWISAGQEPLFAEDDGAVSAQRTLDLPVPGEQGPRPVDTLAPWTPDTRHGFVRLTLGDQDFYHDAFAGVMTRQALASAHLPDEVQGAYYRNADGDTVIGDTNTEGAPGEVIVPNAPYTPALASVQLSYEAVLTAAEHPGEVTLIHLHPFGVRVDPPVEEDAAGSRLLPEYGDEGTLYLGVRDLAPRQSLSVLFQAAEATADTDLEKATVQWSYLAGNDWKAFDEIQIPVDTTRGLIASGRIEFSIPADATTEHTVLPSGMIWLKASVDHNAGAVSELVGVHPQAVRATFVDRGNDPGHLAEPLPAETISKLVESDPKVKGLVQPYASFGGRPPEDALPFYTRVSEHLRHKRRAVTLFDYERLVLEEFPAVYKVKCINHTNENHETAPGHVLVAVIPDLSGLPAADRRAPKVTFDVLETIKEFLDGLNSPFVTTPTAARGGLHVLNPKYESIRVAFSVQFRAGVTSISYEVRELQRGIVRFLSPWAYEDAADISFGGAVYKSSILQFVEEQPAVDFVTDFRMMHGDSTADVDVIEAGTPRSILIPAPAAEHAVTPLASPCPATNVRSPGGIGALTLSQDFLVDD